MGITVNRSCNVNSFNLPTFTFVMSSKIISRAIDLDALHFGIDIVIEFVLHGRC